MIRALIAEDEPLLARALRDQLALAWPELVIEAIVDDGAQALARIGPLAPEVVFLDIRMPGVGGLAVAQALAEGQVAIAGRPAGWSPLVVFVTAYDQYAVDAFESAAVDYLLKPVTEERLARCVARLRDRLAARAASAQGGVSADLAALARALHTLAVQTGAHEVAAPARLQFIRASLGDVVRQIPVDEILYLEASDKYVSVFTRDSSALVRMPLTELMAALDPASFVQIHRSTVVRLAAIDTIRRDIAGRQFVHLRERVGGREVRLPVSRQHAGQFRGL